MTDSQKPSVAFYCPPPARELLPRGARLAVGFGSVIVTKDEAVIWEGDDEDVTISRFEAQAEKEPGLWRVEFVGPLQGTTYERHAPGAWVLIASNEGFA